MLDLREYRTRRRELADFLPWAGLVGPGIVLNKEKLKKVRKKLAAAKAIDRPNTIWISRRKPPEVSPKASVRPVTVMMITEMIFATGPCTDSRMELSGVSHGMEEPEA